MPGVSVTPSDNGGAVVEMRRSRLYTFDPQAGSRDSGGPPAQSVPAQVQGPLSVKKCPAAFQVDALPIDAASVDGDVRPEMIEAIEVYAGGQVPIEFSARNADC